MDVKPEHAIRLLRDRDFLVLGESAQREVLSLFIDDKEKPSQVARVIMALNIQAAYRVLQEPLLEAMAMDILFGSDKQYIIDTLNRVQILLLNVIPE